MLQHTMDTRDDKIVSAGSQSSICGKDGDISVLATLATARSSDILALSEGPAGVDPPVAYRLYRRRFVGLVGLVGACVYVRQSKQR